MSIQEFIGTNVHYDKDGGDYIWGERGNGLQIIAQVRGWGAIQNLFKNKKGQIDLQLAAKFQDELGDFIASAIQEKLDREKLN